MEGRGEEGSEEVKKKWVGCCVLVRREGECLKRNEGGRVEGSI
jgi:hypothetical protein